MCHYGVGFKPKIGLNTRVDYEMPIVFAILAIPHHHTRSSIRQEQAVG